MGDEDSAHPRWAELPSSEATARLLPALRLPEATLAKEILVAARARGFEELAGAAELQQRALEQAAYAASMYPSPLGNQTLGQRQRNIDTLIARLTAQNTFSIELVIPTRAVMGHALQTARLNFFRMLRHALDEIGEEKGDLDDLRVRVEEAIAECIAVRATEELLKAIVCACAENDTTRERAALLLLKLWHNGTSRKLAELLPVLSATWQARRRARVAFGTLLGASEMFSLLAAGADVRFLNFLTRDDVTDEEVGAFQEFLFGLSWEELNDLRQRHDNVVISLDDILQDDVGTSPVGILQAGDQAERFFLFFMKRHLLAAHRAQMNLPGPKQTAEQYVLAHLLASQWESVEGG